MNPLKKVTDFLERIIITPSKASKKKPDDEKVKHVQKELQIQAPEPKEKKRKVTFEIVGKKNFKTTRKSP